MDRIYGFHQCHVCFGYSPLGWVYTCRQDTVPSNFFESRPSPEPKSPLRQELEEIGLSNSIIAGAERGEYTHAQLEKLKAQKMNLRMVISSIKRERRQSLTTDDKGDIASQRSTISDGSASPASSTTSTTTLSTENDSPRSRRKSQISPPCTFNCCHTCRHYYKDRIYLSIEAVIDGAVPPIDPSEVKNFSIKDAGTLRAIGLRQPLHLQQLKHCDSIDITSIPSVGSKDSKQTRWSDLGIAQRLKNAASFYINKSHSTGEVGNHATKISNRPSPFGTRARVRELLRNIATGLHRDSTNASTSGSSSAGRDCDGSYGDLSSVSLGVHQGTGVWEGDEGDCKIYAHSTPDWSQETSSSDEFWADASEGEGEEVEVDGGKALTEESVEQHLPDIITQA